MSDLSSWIRNSVFAVAAPLLMAASGQAQSGGGTIQGQVTDVSGAAVPAIMVVSVSAGGARQEVQTNEEGRYIFRHLAAGAYTIQIQLKGFAPFQKAGVTVAAGRTQRVDARLEVATEKQKVTVQGESVHPSVTLESNSSALILKGSDLDALSDDPDELSSQLQALAGPAAGPNGGEIYIDGFTGGQLPPKSAIREIRVNQNPFSAQYDKLGYGRIEILTKPGQDQWHGQVFSMFNDSALNSRNPFATEQPGYHRDFVDGHVGGPLSKKASLAFDVGHRNMSSDSIVSAVVLDSNLQQNVLQPGRVQSADQYQRQRPAGLPANFQQHPDRALSVLERQRQE